MSIKVDSATKEDVEYASKSALEVKVLASEEEYKRCSTMLVNLKLIQSEIDDLFDEAISEANKAHRKLTSQKASLVLPLQEAELHLKDLIAKFSEAQAKLLQQDADAEYEDMIDQERAQWESQIEVLRARGDDEMADHMESMGFDESCVPRPQPRELKSRKEISFRKTYTFEVEDINQVPIEYLTIDRKKVGAIVKSMKMDAPKVVPGIRVIEKRGVAVTVGSV